MLLHGPSRILDPAEHAVRRLVPMPELSGSTEVSDTCRIAATNVSS